MLKDKEQECLKSKPLELKRLGIDEIAWVKGQGNYCAVLIDLEPSRLEFLGKEHNLMLEKFLVSGEQRF